MQENEEPKYAGFWIRVWASIVDTILLLLITVPILLAVYGTQLWESAKAAQGPIHFLVSWVLPPIAIIIFWIYKSATPGKMTISLIIVDAKSGKQPTPGQFIGRYLGYFVSTLPCMLGFIWVAFDKRKQGWHDKLAGTVVIHKKNRP